MPVDVVADLEQDVGRPIITEILADLAGFVLVPKAQAEALGLNFHGHFADVSRADTDVEAGMADALRDGQVSPAEAASLLPKVRRAEQEMAELEKDLIQLAAANVTPMRRGA
ncbi:hypothetical protein ABLE91_05630 [Aquabacter sp. CN5-332]|uniref:hypothetical protein n=1 Tax=Aquabacter sp. CN5-332 TaxID=3156608 RepID=UPI0032B58B8E